jgi:hypothetical protein
VAGTLADRARSGHAAVPRGRNGEAAIMTDKRPELGRNCLERVTGIEPALSAWESDRSRPLTALTWATEAPLLTVIAPMTPRLMARQWPVTLPALGRSRCARPCVEPHDPLHQRALPGQPPFRSIGPRDLGDGLQTSGDNALACMNLKPVARLGTYWA